ncbi:MAG: NUDIX domain-containing protein [Candidatus Hodarchaeales archaeon]|jgi:8-oxo-dGTP pyrophosphatase MutT (NUDIX family)
MNSKDGRFCVGIGTILEHRITQKILLLRRSSKVDFAVNIWDDVGGRMRQFETPEETLRREVYEETGITDLVIIKPIDVSNYYRGERKAENQMVVITYWCQTAATKIKLSSEHDQFQWVTPVQGLTITDDPNIQKTIQQFIEEKKGGRERIDNQLFRKTIRPRTK